MKIYLSAFIILIILGVANYFGQAYGLPFILQGYDVYLHLMGGAGLALLFLGVHRSMFGVQNAAVQGEVGKPREKTHTIALLVCGVFAAGLIWECFEAYYNIAGAQVGTLAYYVDTAKDLTNDVLGAILALYIVRKSVL